MTSNPLDDLRQINRDQRATQEPPASTGLREAVNTEARQPARAAGRKPGHAPARQEGSTPGITSARQAGLPPAIAQASQDALSAALTDTPPDLREAVRETVGQRRVYQGGVKATIDLAPELSTRFKRYSIDHSNVTLRQILTELLDAYLAGEGY